MPPCTAVGRRRFVERYTEALLDEVLETGGQKGVSTMKALTLEDLKPLIIATLENPDHWALTDDVEDVRYTADRERTAIAELRRIASDAPDNEPATVALFDAACDLFGLDPFGIGVPGVPDDLDLDMIPWTVGIYRAFFREVFPDPNGPATALERIQRHSTWRALFYEAAAALREADPPPPPALSVAQPVDTREPLTLAEAAKRLGARKETVARLLKSGELRGGLVGRRWRVPCASIETFLREGRR